MEGCIKQQHIMEEQIKLQEKKQDIRFIDARIFFSKKYGPEVDTKGFVTGILIPPRYDLELGKRMISFFTGIT